MELNRLHDIRNRPSGKLAPVFDQKQLTHGVLEVLAELCAGTLTGLGLDIQDRAAVKIFLGKPGSLSFPEHRLCRF